MTFYSAMSSIQLKKPKPIVRELLKNSLFLSLGQVYQLGLSALLNILLARRLGPTLTGVYIATQAMIGLIMVFANLGIEVPFKREVSRNWEQFPVYFGSALAIRFTISAPITFVISLIAGVLLGIAPVPVIILMVLLMTLISLAALSRASFQALNHFDVGAKLTVLGQTIYVSGVAFVLWLSSNLQVVLIAMILLQMSILMLNLIVLWRMGYHFTLWWDRRFWKKMIEEALPVMLANSGEYANLRLDSIVIAATLGSFLAGIYGVAYSFYLMVAILVYLPSVSAFPTLARYSASHQLPAYQKFVSKLGIVIVGYALVIAIMLFFTAPFLLLLLYGATYLGSLRPLRILVFALPFVAFNRLMVQSLNASELQQWTFVATTSGAASNITANVLLIPRYGIMSAAVTTLATEFLVGVVAYIGLLIAVRKQRSQQLSRHTLCAHE